MAAKEAKARIKINRLLEEAGWRFFDIDNGKTDNGKTKIRANVLLENNVKITQNAMNELDEEFDKFDSRYMPKSQYFDYAKTVFRAYILDTEFREIIDKGLFSYLNLNPYGEAFKRLPPELRKAIPEYIKDFVPFNKFAA